MLFIIFLIMCSRGSIAIGAFLKILLGLIFLIIDIVLIKVIIFIAWMLF